MSPDDVTDRRPWWPNIVTAFYKHYQFWRNVGEHVALRTPELQLYHNYPATAPIYTPTYIYLHIRLHMYAYTCIIIMSRYAHSGLAQRVGEPLHNLMWIKVVLLSPSISRRVQPSYTYTTGVGPKRATVVRCWWRQTVGFENPLFQSQNRNETTTYIYLCYLNIHVLLIYYALLHSKRIQALHGSFVVAILFK